MDKKTAPIAEQKATPAPMPMPQAEMPETEGVPQAMPEQNTMPIMGQNMMPTPLCNTCMYGMTNTCPLMMGTMPNMNPNMMPANVMPETELNMMPANIMPNMTPNMMPANIMPNMTPNMMPANVMPNMTPNMQAVMPEANMPQVQPAAQEKKSREYDYEDDLDDIDDFEDYDNFDGSRAPEPRPGFGPGQGPGPGPGFFPGQGNINPDRCVRIIERNNPGIFRRLTRAGIPYYEAVNIVRRIVSETINNCCRR